MSGLGALKVVIIGGGSVGCGCGHYLACGGAHVTILEQQFLASGASGANAGLLALGPVDRPEVTGLYMEARRLMKEQIAQEIGDFEYVHGGMLFVALDEGEARVLEERAKDYRAAGIQCENLTTREIVREEPILSPELSGGLFVPKTGHFNPFLLTVGLARSVVARGGKVLTGVKAQSIEKKGKGFSVRANGEVFSSDAVVLATGWQASELAAPMGLVLPVVPARGQIIISEPLAPMTRKTIISLHHLYMRQTVSGTCQIGSHTELVGPSKEVTLAKLGEYARDVTRIIPFFDRVRMLRAYAGLRPLSPDELPMVGGVPGIEGLILACGHSRSGVSLALLTGKIVSELLLEGHTSLDVSPWSPSRFGGRTFEECYHGQ
jgi:glycine/D-amino acid oxidase-like deaminating enzyme